MCLITACPEGTEKDVDSIIEYVERGMLTNRDGSGIMWKRKGSNEVNIKKGFRSSKDLLNFVASLRLEKPDELIIHHRTGTSGDKNDINMHPFLLTEDVKLLQSTEGAFKIGAMAHNGVFSQYSDYLSPFSDTFHFVQMFAAIPEITSLIKRDPHLFTKMFKGGIGWNKLAFLFPDRKMVLVGNFVEDKGYYHSHEGYKRIIYDRGGVQSNNGLVCAYNPNEMHLDDDGEWDVKHDRFVRNRSRKVITASPTVLVKDEDLEKIRSEIKEIQNRYKNRICFKQQDIELTEKNYHHFIIIPTEDYDEKIKKNSAHTLERYDPEALLNWVCNYEDESEIYAIPLEKLLKISNLFVRNNYQDSYAGLYSLIKKTNRQPSPSMLKKINKALTKNFGTDDFFQFKGFGKFHYFDLNHFYNQYKEKFEDGKTKVQPRVLEQLTLNEHLTV